METLRLPKNQQQSPRNHFEEGLGMGFPGIHQIFASLMSAPVGIQCFRNGLDFRLRGNDV
jgi:hypothetical protein